MTSPHVPIVVLTPVRNEESLLPRFLSVCARFAEHVIIADQGSTDRSREISRSFPQVHLMENPDKDYHEGRRQKLLYAEARRLVPGPRILLALDADEILAADAISSSDWQKMREATPGTVIYLEKPDLMPGLQLCHRRDPFPMGYVDDGAEIAGEAIHSFRVPLKEGHPRLVLNDVKVLHYSCARTSLIEVKRAFYIMQENIKNTRSLLRRYRYYRDCWQDWYEPKGLKPVDEAWFKGWEDAGIDLRTIPESAYTFYHEEGLKLLAQWGVERFAWDDIWMVPWEQSRQEALARGQSAWVPGPIKAPGRWRGKCLNALVALALKFRP